jgi:hypothetical protein
LQNANFVRRFKPLEDHRYLPAAHSSINAWCGQAQPWPRQAQIRIWQNDSAGEAHRFAEKGPSRKNNTKKNFDLVSVCRLSNCRL